MSDIMPAGVEKVKPDNKIDPDRLIFTIGLVDSSLMDLTETIDTFNELTTDALLSTIEPFENFKKEIGRVMSDFLEPISITTELLNNLSIPDKINVEIAEEDSLVPIKPTKQMVAKAGDIGALYLADVISDTFPKEKKEEENKDNTLLGSLLGTVLGPKIAKIASKFGGLRKLGLIGGIATSVIWLAVDGIKGFMKAEDWGTSKLSAVVGSVFAGTDSGIKNAFANAGKLAVLGATIGRVVPVVGTITGGLIGAALGGVLGFFGGENLALGFDSIYNKIKDEIIPNIKDAIFSWLSFAKGEISGKELADSLKKLIPESVSNFFNRIKETIESFDLGEIVGTFFIDLFNSIKEGFFKKENWKEPENKKPSIDLMKGGWRDTGNGLYNVETQEFKDYEGNILRKGNKKVNDAIITKTGEIINTSPDDNIIATKNMPIVDNDIKNILSELKSGISSSANNLNQELINAINVLIDTLIKTGQIKNIFATNNNSNVGFDYESLKKIPL